MSEPEKSDVRSRASAPRSQPPNASAAATLLLGALLTVQILLAIRSATGPLAGDEPYYAAKARYFAEHHRFAPASSSELAVESGRRWGVSDWRPPGYPLFVAFVAGRNFDPPGLHRRVAAIQSGLMAIAIILVFRTIARLTSNRSHLAIAAALGVAPWPFEFTTLIGPDSLTASVSAIGLVVLASAVRKSSARAAFAGALLLSITFTFRPETIVLPPLLIVAAALLSSRHRRHIFLAGVGAFAIVLAGQCAYREAFVGRLQVFGPQRLPDQGAFDWAGTWIGTEHENDYFVFSLRNGQGARSVPDRAFGDAAEQAAFETIINRVQREGGYSETDDRAFAALARKRWHDHPVTVLAARLWHPIHLWVNSETNSQLLAAFTRVPRRVRQALLGMLLLFKLAAIAAFAFAVVQTVRKGPAEPFSALCILFVVVRTVLIGVILNSQGHRLMVSDWTPLLASSIVLLAQTGRHHRANAH